MSLIQHVQERLHHLYDVEVAAKAEDFLIGCDEVAKLLRISREKISSKELFLVNPSPSEEESVEVALYLQDQLCENLANNHPMQELNEQNISDFCVMIEGVSHFVYYLYQSAQKNSVSQLELELQAEIDKFLLLSLMTEANQHHFKQIMDLLFEGFHLHDELTSEQKQRYLDANHLAKRYCYLLTQKLKSEPLPQILNEVRSFYSLSHHQKIQFIMGS